MTARTRTRQLGTISFTGGRHVHFTAEGDLATPRLTATLIGLFAALALIVTPTGTTGVMATTVTHRTQEFGVRLGLGARGPQMLGMILRQGLTLVVVGPAWRATMVDPLVALRSE